ncbi:hypothetical protein ACFE04_021369 [Oxalis oulophora]
MPRKPRFVATPSPILPVPNPAPVAPSHIVPPRVHVLSSTLVASTDETNTTTPSTLVASIDASNTTTQNSSVSLPPQSFNGYWDIKLIDENGNIMEAKKKVKDVWSLKRGVKVVLDINDVGQPIDKSGSLFGFFLGDLGANFSTFPIGYRSWKQVPKSTKKDVFNSIIKAKFHFDDSDKSFEKYVIGNIGTKWKDNLGRLFRQFYDSSLSRAHNIAHGPKGIDQDQWTMYVNYRLEPRTKEKGGEIISRGTLWTLTHKRKHDGQYVNLKAEKIVEKIISIEEQDENARILSPQDSLRQVFGSEHNGRIRGMGFGPVPTQVFGQTSYMGKRSAFGAYIINCVNVGINKIATVETMANLFQESDVENAGQES